MLKFIGASGTLFGALTLGEGGGGEGADLDPCPGAWTERTCRQRKA